MTDSPLIDPALPSHVESAIQNRSLGLIQAEFGALQTNFFMMQARVEALMEMRVLDLATIEGLKKRAFTAEDNVKILQGQLKEALEKTMPRKNQKTKTPRV